MSASDDKMAAEARAMRRTGSVIAEVTERLKLLGLYGIDVGADGRCVPVAIDPQRRRELLMFLSELEELVRTMEAFTGELSSNIEMHDRSRNAVAVYRETGAACRQYRRHGKH